MLTMVASRTTISCAVPSSASTAHRLASAARPAFRCDRTSHHAPSRRMSRAAGTSRFGTGPQPPRGPTRDR